MPMPTDTPEERRVFRERIASELPAFVAHLLSWEIPAELRTTKHASRFGHDHFHHPRLAADLFEQEPESSLLYILDNCPDLYVDGKAWGWGAADLLREQLTGDVQSGRFATQARKLYDGAGGWGKLLSKLQEKLPERFTNRHTNKGNVWLIRAPEQ